MRKYGKSLDWISRRKRFIRAFIFARVVALEKAPLMAHRQEYMNSHSKLLATWEAFPSVLSLQLVFAIHSKLKLNKLIKRFKTQRACLGFPEEVRSQTRTV